VDRNTERAAAVEYPTRGINRKRTSAQLNGVRPGDAGDVSPPVHHDPPAHPGGARNEIPRELQASKRWNAPRAEVHGY
jgi:hypothetical protein